MNAYTFLILTQGIGLGLLLAGTLVHYETQLENWWIALTSRTVKVVKRDS